MSTKAYESTKSVITGKYSSVESFIVAVNSFINGTSQSSETTELHQPPRQEQVDPTTVQEIQSSQTPTLTPATQLESVNSLTPSPASLVQNEQSLSSSPLQRPSASCKRNSLVSSNQQSLPKRLKYISDSIDEEIEKHRIG